MAHRHAREGRTIVNLQSSPEPTLRNRTVAEWLWPFVPMGIAALSLSALWYYHLHRHEFVPQSVLQRFYAGFYRQVGFAPSVMFFGMAILWSTLWCVQGRIERPVGRLLRLSAMAVMLGIFLNLGDGGVVAADHKGEIGAEFARTLVAAFGYVPSLLVVWAMTLATVLLATDFFFYDSFERLRRSAPSPMQPDAGVEPAVTEQLRALAAGLPSSGAASVAVPGAVAAPAASDDGAASAAARPEVVPPGPRRATYYERRHERAAARARADEDWVPAAPDSQEIDNPESSEPLPPAAPTEAAEALRWPAAPAATEAKPVPIEPGPDFEPVGAADEPPPVEPLDTESEEQAAPSGSETIVEIPRPDPRPLPESSPEPVVAAAAGKAGELERVGQAPLEPVPAAELSAEPVQQHLFGTPIDEALVQEAVDVVTLWRRASAAFLQRKLRIDYETAMKVLAELAARGVVRIDGDGAQGRVVDRA